MCSLKLKHYHLAAYQPQLLKNTIACSCFITELTVVRARHFDILTPRNVVFLP